MQSPFPSKALALYHDICADNPDRESAAKWYASQFDHYYPSRGAAIAHAYTLIESLISRNHVREEDGLLWPNR